MAKRIDLDAVTVDEKKECLVRNVEIIHDDGENAEVVPLDLSLRCWRDKNRWCWLDCPALQWNSELKRLELGCLGR